MRSFVIGFIIVTAIFSSAKDRETIEQLEARAAAAEPGKQSKLYLELSEREVQQADQEYNSNVEQAKSFMEKAIESAEKAADASVQTGKNLKQVEIGLRKLSKRLEDLSRSWAVEDRAPIKAAIQTIDAARSKLLDRMFKK